MSIDVQKIRQDFPILNLQVNGKPYIYFDNAATTHKPIQVIKALEDFYFTKNSNVHRGNYYLSHIATEAYENARERVQKFLNAGRREEIVFTSGATEAINLVAATWGRKHLGKGDEIILSTMEHHSNIIPWQLICGEKNACIRTIPLNDKQEIVFEEYEKLFSPKTKLVSITHVSNTLGTVNPVKKVIDTAHKHGIPVLIDGAQAVPHIQVDVRDIDCDFYVFSGHKVYGPTGIGALFAKYDLLNEMPPYQGGGEMIDQVSFEKSTYNEVPYKFEAGTPNFADAVALTAALDYLTGLGYDHIYKYEMELLHYTTEKLQQIDGIKIFGTSEHKAAVISFIVEGTHPTDVGTLLDKMNVFVRTGHHCTQPLMHYLGIPGTLRVSFAFYNTFEEIDVFVEALKNAISMLH
jgi:cysteine desulfurase / selenocysteine lyase